MQATAEEINDTKRKQFVDMQEVDVMALDNREYDVLKKMAKN